MNSISKRLETLKARMMCERHKVPLRLKDVTLDDLNLFELESSAEDIAKLRIGLAKLDCTITTYRAVLEKLQRDDAVPR